MDNNTSVDMVSHLLSPEVPFVKLVFHIPEDQRRFSNTSLTQQDHLKGITSSAILACTSPGATAADRHCFRFLVLFLFNFQIPFLSFFYYGFYGIFSKKKSPSVTNGQVGCWLKIRRQIWKVIGFGVLGTDTPHFDLNLLPRKKQTKTLSGKKNEISKQCSIIYPSVNLLVPLADEIVVLRNLSI